jgi:transcriptional regulator with XRE-family HTH domain
MTPVERKIYLLKRNVKQSELAREFKVSFGMIAGLINNRFKSDRLKARIARYLNINFTLFWSDESLGG